MEQTPADARAAPSASGLWADRHGHGNKKNFLEESATPSGDSVGHLGPLPPLFAEDGFRAACTTTAWRYLVGLANIPRGPRGLPIALV
eukprot:scaffold7659_cov140-Isochrysis_galbana.AAC.1